MPPDKDAIDALTAAFFGAFTTCNSIGPDVDRLYRQFIPEAIIVRNLAGTLHVSDVRGFVEPRRTILTNGSLEDFSEWEVSESTEIFGNIAQRFSRYEKSWRAAGQDQTGSGTKSIQFIRTPDGWKISALAWDDD